MNTLADYRHSVTERGNTVSDLNRMLHVLLYPMFQKLFLVYETRNKVKEIYMYIPISFADHIWKLSQCTAYP